MRIRLATLKQMAVDRDMTQTDHRVLFYILASANPQGQVDVQQNEIADALNIRDTQVSASIKTLKELNFLEPIDGRSRRRNKIALTNKVGVFRRPTPKHKKDLKLSPEQLEMFQRMERRLDELEKQVA